MASRPSVSRAELCGARELWCYTDETHSYSCHKSSDSISQPTNARGDRALLATPRLPQARLSEQKQQPAPATAWIGFRCIRNPRTCQVKGLSTAVGNIFTSPLKHARGSYLPAVSHPAPRASHLLVWNGKVRWLQCKGTEEELAE